MKFPDVVGIPTFFASFFALHVHGSHNYNELDLCEFSQSTNFVTVLGTVAVNYWREP